MTDDASDHDRKFGHGSSAPHILSYLPAILLAGFAVVLFFLIGPINSIASSACPPQGGQCVWEVNESLIHSIVYGLFIGAIVLVAAAIAYAIIESRDRGQTAGRGSPSHTGDDRREVAGQPRTGSATTVPSPVAINEQVGK